MADRVAAVGARLKPHLGEKYDGVMKNYGPNVPTVGTVEQVTEHLAALRDAGVGYTISYFPEMAYDTSGIELFETKVIPELA